MFGSSTCSPVSGLISRFFEWGEGVSKTTVGEGMLVSVNVGVGVFTGFEVGVEVRDGVGFGEDFVPGVCVVGRGVPGTQDMVKINNPKKAIENFCVYFTCMIKVTNIDQILITG